MFKNRKIPHWIFWYVVAILLVAGAVNGLMYLAVPTLPDLNAPTWLTFWGSYLGGAIGCIPALLALYDNRREARKQHEESEKSRRLAVMPVFDCRIRRAIRTNVEKDSKLHIVIDAQGVLREVDYIGDEDQELSNYISCNCIDLCNCGLGPALQAKLCFNGHSVDLFNLKNGYTSHYLFDPAYHFLSSLDPENTVLFTVECQDIYGHYYEQDLFFKISRGFIGKIDFWEFQTVSVGTPRLLEPRNT